MLEDPTTQTNAPIANLAFYQFFHVHDVDSLRDEIYAKASELDLKGTVLVASEGVNVMLAGTQEATDTFILWIRSFPDMLCVQIKISYSDYVPFQKLLVKIKTEIVTMRVDNVDTICQTGHQLPPQTFRDWLRNDEPIFLIDTRNSYEYALGTFKGAVDPNTRQFNEFPQWVEEHRADMEGKKIVMFCTGGIRCEKATSWMMDNGFPEVYQLEGGVLNYFLSIPDAEKDWIGDLFVFDDRVAIDTHNNETDAHLCHVCGLPVKESVGLVHDHSSPSLTL